jgi:hypothetical protein
MRAASSERMEEEADAVEMTSSPSETEAAHRMAGSSTEGNSCDTWECSAGSIVDRDR